MDEKDENVADSTLGSEPALSLPNIDDLILRAKTILSELEAFRERLRSLRLEGSVEIAHFRGTVGTARFQASDSEMTLPHGFLRIRVALSKSGISIIRLQRLKLAHCLSIDRRYMLTLLSVAQVQSELSMLERLSLKQESESTQYVP